jgi:hypothetical protein
VGTTCEMENVMTETPINTNTAVSNRRRMNSKTRI